MTSAEQIVWDDSILPFQLDASDVRGRVARLDNTLDEILTQHDYPTVVSDQVAQAVMLTAMIGQTLKLRWKLSLQIRGDGPLRLIATDYFAPGKDGQPAQIRAYASYDADTLDEQADGFAQIGKGMFAIIIDQGQGMQPYQGITPLAGGSLAACAETYFAQSEQLPTRFVIAGVQEAGDDGLAWRAGGIMLQHMPPAGSHVQTDEGSGEGGLLQAGDLINRDDAEDWNRVTTLAETVELTELVGPRITPERLLIRLFHEESPRVFDAQAIRFGCTCGPEKVVQTMSIYSSKDVEQMTDESGMVTADCQFCGAHYELDPAALGFEADPELTAKAVAQAKVQPSSKRA
ncbi:Hsp33 family molecular chaperone HslO [Pontivivens insulae]|uniref:33 kDa chaperonin n=1 Tax=Pontivivens insulae TaxID=1639689 RepID=A0A2R8A742_9RHOB|nr:Hsp33 family molecular chaperone HslO [Pontivivens insulae]RED18157.1 molecular chaperone Hsp33 [Pontivivens insulae]SPF28054.1 33 kDa chaperonin [Pontivivens insulae]